MSVLIATAAAGLLALVIRKLLNQTNVAPQPVRIVRDRTLRRR